MLFGASRRAARIADVGDLPCAAFAHQIEQVVTAVMDLAVDVEIIPAPDECDIAIDFDRGVVEAFLIFLRPRSQPGEELGHRAADDLAGAVGGFVGDEEIAVLARERAQQLAIARGNRRESGVDGDHHGRGLALRLGRLAGAFGERRRGGDLEEEGEEEEGHVVSF